MWDLQYIEGGLRNGMMASSGSAKPPDHDDPCALKVSAASGPHCNDECRGEGGFHRDQSLPFERPDRLPFTHTCRSKPLQTKKIYEGALAGGKPSTI